MLETIKKDKDSAVQCRALADEVETALARHAIVDFPGMGKIYAYEVDAYGNYYCSDDGNVPSLLSLPYTGAVKIDDPLYQNTRRYVLSAKNPYYCIGKAAEGPGGPHVGNGMVWPLGLILRVMTSTDENEIRTTLKFLQTTHAGTGFMHEAFNKDDAKKFTRSWFAWANTIFGEMLLHVQQNHPHLLD